LKLVTEEAEKLKGTKDEKLWSNMAMEPLQSTQKELSALLAYFDRVGNKKAAQATRTAIGFMWMTGFWG
jgi:hypothetical protein